MKLLSIFSFKEVRQFILYFALILLAFIGVIETVFYHLGETIPYDRVLKLQSGGQRKYLPKYFNVKPAYKEAYLQEYYPEIIVLGTSRIMSLKQSDIKGPLTFYNAAVDASTGNGLVGMQSMLDNIPSRHLPEVIVIGIDAWLFNPMYPLNKVPLNRDPKKVSALQRIKSICKFARDRWNGYQLFVTEKQNILSGLKEDDQNVGLNARLFGSGFSPDGHLEYPKDQEIEAVDDFETWEETLQADRYRFAAAESVHPEAVTFFKGILDFAQANNIAVVGVLPPFRPDMYEALTTVETHRLYFEDFRKKICRILKEGHSVCLDFSNPNTLDLTSDDFIDRMHPKSYVYEKIGQRIADSLD